MERMRQLETPLQKLTLKSRNDIRKKKYPGYSKLDKNTV
jgi:hypothetical protein